ncbi:Gfo/Idh/MocA family protein [Oceaniglobus ichthyenteri]|uniref:Gfo/Idh/MocA family protein n=1 Tax=Oceaniglobus ichthyenteri TaxID=2136177 RepID=UPI001F0C9A24|nr:Gfo/Idh/MocA family oxidoreductase [Oceaniglobus ichthyenteri]
MIRSVSIIGAGIGAQHLLGYGALPDRYQIHSICDLDAERGGALARTHPDVTYGNDYNAILADPKVDVVDICLPPHLHFSAILAALEAGKIVVCEKPLVASLAEADQLADKVAQTGGIVSPVFQYRYGLGTAQLLALIEAGLAGRCYAGTLETHWNREKPYYDIPWRGTWAGERGGALLGHAIHIHDLLAWLIGPVAQVFADTATRVNDIEVEDCAALSIRMECGALITSSVTLGAADDTSRMRLLFEGFTVESDHAPYSLAEKSWRFTARAPTTQTQIDAVLAQVSEAKTGFAGMFEALADTLDGQGGRDVTLQDGRRSLEFVTAVYASARSNLPVALPLARDHPLYGGWVPDAARER